MELSFFTITFLSNIRFAPALIAMVVMAGNNSGAIPTANAKANKADSTIPLCPNRFTIKIKTANTKVIFIKKKPKSLMPFSKVVSTDADALCAILPKIVSLPVAITNAFAVPLTTLLPSHKQFFLLANSVCSSITPTSFLTGYDSPVRLASFTFSSFASIKIQSAGIISPALNSSTSPFTICEEGISFDTLSLKTELFKAIIDCSFSTTLPAFLS